MRLSLLSESLVYCMLALVLIWLINVEFTEYNNNTRVCQSFKFESYLVIIMCVKVGSAGISNLNHSCV